MAWAISDALGDHHDCAVAGPGVKDLRGYEYTGAHRPGEATGAAAAARWIALEIGMPDAVIVDAVRTPIGRAFKGSLAQLRPDEMGTFVVDALLERNPEVDPASIEDLYCGVGLPQGLHAFNLARIMVLLSERLPVSVNGATISRYCASSLESIRQAANAVRAGQGDAYIAAGVEWVSRYNEAVEGARP